jgi:hypothetical protein
VQSYKRPPVLPIHHCKQGRETENFKVFFGPEQEDACCGGCVIA